MLEKLSGDAVEPDQLARLHDIGLKASRCGQPRDLQELRLSGGSWETWYYGVLVALSAAPRASSSCVSMENMAFSTFSAE